MLKKTLIGLAVVLSLFAIYVALQPSEYRFQREITINASPKQIFPHINNTRKMNAWNPFVKMDHNIKLSYEGPQEGVGAISTFEGEKVGKGRSVVTQSVPNSLVRTDLEFIKPFAGA